LQSEFSGEYCARHGLPLPKTANLDTLTIQQQIKRDIDTLNAATDAMKQAFVAKLAVRRAKSALEPAENIRGKAETAAKLKKEEALRLNGLKEQYGDWYAKLTSRAYTGDRLTTICCALGQKVSGNKDVKAGEILLAGATTEALMNAMITTATATSLLTKRAAKVSIASEQPKKRKVTTSTSATVAMSAAMSAAAFAATATTAATTADTATTAATAITTTATTSTATATATIAAV
jgi:ribosomal protein L27